MRSIERLEKNRRIKEAARRVPPADEEMEEEIEFPTFSPFNTLASIYDRSREKRFGGINTADSVFDRYAFFHTQTGEKE